MANFIKHDHNIFTALNQNGFNQALYEYCRTPGTGLSKQEIRGLVESWPTSYPATFILDGPFEYVEKITVQLLDLDKIKNEIKTLKKLS